MTIDDAIRALEQAARACGGETPDWSPQLTQRVWMAQEQARAALLAAIAQREADAERRGAAVERTAVLSYVRMVAGDRDTDFTLDDVVQAIVANEHRQTPATGEKGEETR